MQFTESLKKSLPSDVKHNKTIANTKIWKEKILPNWSKLKNTKKVRDLCYRGIPPSLRGKIWTLLIDNSNKISDEYYQQLVQIANSLYLEAADRENDLDSMYKNNIKEGGLNDCNKESASSNLETASMESIISENRFESSSESTQVVLDIEVSETRHNISNSHSGDGNTDELDEGFIADEELLVCPSFKFKSDSESSSDLFDVGSSNNIDHLNDFVEEGEYSFSSRDSDILNRATLYDICQNDIVRTELSQISDYSSGISDVKNNLLCIERDIPRTFPTLAFFHNGGPLEHSLRRVLRAFTCYKTDIGYVQGLSFIVAMLLLYMDEAQAFRCLVNLIHRRGPTNLAFYKIDQFVIKKYVTIFDEYFQDKLPSLSKHMKSEQVSSEMFLIDWNITLFSKALSLELAARIWDCYLFEGESFVCKASLGILKCLSSEIKGKAIEEILPILSHVPNEINTDVFMSYIFQIRINRKEYENKILEITTQNTSSTNYNRTDRSGSSAFSSYFSNFSALFSNASNASSQVFNNFINMKDKTLSSKSSP